MKRMSASNSNDDPHDAAMRNVTVPCGWGRLIFGQTFSTAESLAKELLSEGRNERDVAFYVRDPHVVLAAAPQDLFLDPSHTYRLRLDGDAGTADTGSVDPEQGIRTAQPGDERQINRLYRSWSMVPVPEDFFSNAPHAALEVLVSEGETADREAAIDGVVMGVDHAIAFDDPENGSSLWALAVDPQSTRPGVGTALVNALAGRFRNAGRSFMDLSVMHDNREAIALYEQLGFDRISIYAVKRKNPINERLFVGPSQEAGLNVYARIIVEEAKRRGIAVDIEDEHAGLFRLTHGGRSIACRESLSDLTTAVAMSRCDDKALTRRLLKRAGLRVPEQISIDDENRNAWPFLETHGRVVVKPARGEQGQGVSVDLTKREDVETAIEKARQHCDHVLMEELVRGDDLRIIVIDNDVVAAAVRRPPAIVGDGTLTARELIGKLSRRRERSTDGESRIPIDNETERCIADAGHDIDNVLPAEEIVVVRKTANLHTGGTIHDVTDELNGSLEAAAIAAARELEMPVVGFDFIVADPSQPGYAIIEANERPGLANHEPQPTAERFIDLLFPHTRPDSRERRDFTNS